MKLYHLRNGAAEPQHRPKRSTKLYEPVSRCLACFGGSLPSFALLMLLLLAPVAHAQTRETTPAEKQLRYQVKLKLDFDNRAYSGSERVHWINRGEHATSVLYFHLYSNLRSESPKTSSRAGDTSAGNSQQSDEPRLDVTGVSAMATGAALPFALDDQGTTLRISLRETVLPGNSSDIEIKFKGTVPEIDPEETGLVTHIVQQVSAALRSDREVRRARDLNFRCRGVMMLGTSYPVLVARDGDDWLRKVESSIGDIVLADPADYAVEIEAPSSVSLFASGELVQSPASDSQKNTSRVFSGDNLRDFAIVAGPTLRSEERRVGNVTVRSVFMPEQERIARNVLGVAAESLRVFSARFGPLPLKNVTIVGAPLVAGLGSAEFSGLGAIASAFYVDFDSTTMRNMPEMIREQRESLEESLEWTVAHIMAHQWWGAAVGSDPAREPVLDEALANWSALLYYRDVRGEEQTARVMEEQLRGVYKVYRTFGGEDIEANRAARDFRNSFQYTAIVGSKGALMFADLQRLLGEEKYFAALKSYYAANALEIADMDDLRGAFIAEAPLNQRRVVARTFDRWLSNKRGDEDIAPPDAHLAGELGLPVKQANQKSDRGALTAFARVGKFFWQQMTRIR